MYIENETNKLSTPIKLFLCLYLILPSYFAIEISTKLPLLTGSRLIILLVFISSIRKGTLRIKKIGERNLNLIICCYFLMMLIINIVSLFQTVSAIKAIFVILFEKAMVIWFLLLYINTKEKLLRALELLVYSATFVACISIVGVAVGINFFELLNIVNREMLMSNYVRLGLTRATAGFGHAVYYGLYNALIIPVIMYFIENKKNNKRFYLCLILVIIALLLANSRGSIFATMFVFGVMILRNRKMFSKYIMLILCVLVGGGIIILLNQQLREWLIGIISAIFSVFNENIIVSENFGRNASGLESRLQQLTAIKWTMERNPLFGMGYEAQNRGVVCVLTSKGTWGSVSTLDSGIVAIISQYGLLGLFTYLLLFIGLFMYTCKNKYKSDTIMMMFCYVFLTYFIGLLSVSDLENVIFVFIGLMLCYANIRRIEDYKV